MNIPLLKLNVAGIFCLALFVVTASAQEKEIVCLKPQDGTPAEWEQGQAWLNGEPPTGVQVAVINQRSAVIVMSSVSEPELGVVVGNGSLGVPDGQLTIQADFEVRTLMIAPHGGSSGKVIQESGKVSLHEVLIALNNAEGLEASYDLNGGSLVVEDLVIGGAGKGSFRLTGSGADAEVGNKLSVGETSELRLIAGGGGMPRLRLAKGASVTFPPGAKLLVEGGAGVAAGKVVLIESDQSLGAQLKDRVEFSGFGQVKIIENAPGLTVEILAP